MAEIAHRHNVLLIDDLGAGALVDLAPYGLPHEPTVQESLAAGADLVLFSADKLIGASQGGIIVGRKDLIARVRSHPLFRAVRSDKVSLMALERTLMLFRDPERLATTHPLYRMLAQTPDELRDRAERLADAIRAAAPTANVQVEPGEGYLGSGSLPMEALPSWQVRLTVPGITAMELARRLRHDPACIVARIEHDAVAIDVRTVTDEQIGAVAAAIERQARS
jgi:L-seryl-tRNA(Ser) seleniumtransferase